MASGSIRSQSLLQRGYSYSYSVGANSSLTITNEQLGISTPDGYTPIGITVATTGNGNVVFRNLAGDGINTNAIYNFASSTSTGRVNISIAYLKL